MAFSPFDSGQDPVRAGAALAAQIDADLRLLAGKVTAVRTYSSLKSLGADPGDRRAPPAQGRASAPGSIAQLATNEPEIAAAIELANRASERHPPGHRQRGRSCAAISPSPNCREQLDRVRAAVEQPVSTAEPWHVWIETSGAGRARRLHRRAPAAVLGRHRRRAGDRLPRVAHGAAGAAPFPASPSSSPKSAGPRTAARATARSRRPATKRCSCAASSQRATRRRLRLLHHGSLRSAVEGALRRRGRRVLGRLRRRSPAEVRIRRADRAHSAVADARRRSRSRSPRCCSACSTCTAARSARAAAACSRSSCMRRRPSRCWIIYDYSQQYLTFTSVLIGTLLIARHARRDRRAARRSARMGRSALGHVTRRAVRLPARGRRTRCRRCRSTCRRTTSRRRC